MYLKLAKPAILFGSILITCLSASGQVVHPSDWPISGGSSDNTHYSPLTTINTHNVTNIQQAWAFETGEKGGLETTPIMVDGVLYAYTPTQKVVAINAATGKLLWKFDPGIVGSRPARAVAFWRSASGKDKRILAGIMNFVYELDANTGKPIDTFGDHGRIDLREDLGRPAAQQSLVITSPAVIYKDLLIVGDATPESLPSPPGDIRAYSVNTGKLRWTFHTIPHPGEFGYDTWPRTAWTYSGSANNWMGMSIDQQRGIVYAPTGSPATDWYGADRIGDNLFADTLLALDAETGKVHTDHSTLSLLGGTQSLAYVVDPGSQVKIARTGVVRARRQSRRSERPMNVPNPTVQNATSVPRLKRKRMPSALAP